MASLWKKSEEYSGFFFSNFGHIENKKRGGPRHRLGNNEMRGMLRFSDGVCYVWGGGRCEGGKHGVGDARIRLQRGKGCAGALEQVGSTRIGPP